MIDWGGWKPLELSFYGSLRTASLETAQKLFAELMTARHQRSALFAGLANQNGVAAPIVATEGSAAQCGTWLQNAVANDPDCQVGSEALIGLAIDLSLWLGEGVIAVAPTVQWTLLTSHPKSTGFHRAVLTGFGKVEHKHYYVDVAHFVAGWLDLVARKRAARADFLATIFATTLADA